MTHFHTGTINVLQEDPGLARHLDHARAHLAMQRAVAGVVSLPKGFFSAHQAIPRARGTFGTLVLEGLLLRAVSVTAQPSLEVLGPGDVFQLDPVGDSYATVATLTGWWALKPARLAVLDEHFTRRMSDYPELIGELAGRLWRRSAASTLGLAIVQEPSLSVRVHFMLWHLADRFGSVDADRVVVPVPLCHTLMSWLVTASRPAVSRALKDLQRTELVEIRPDGSWRLGKTPPEGFGELANIPVEFIAA